MRVAGLVPGVGVLGSQAGHLVAYALRFGGGAQQIQSTGAHAYFPSLVKTGLGAAAFAFLGALAVIGFARLLGGGRIEKDSVPSFVRLLAVLYTVQLACFGVQETAEALLGGTQAASATDLLLWGTAGQLPVALVGALAMRWLLARLGPALAHLKVQLAAAFQLLPYSAAVVMAPVGARVVLSADGLASSLNPRAPPSS
jgi:uncharacterized membrane protein YjfL (UPF0719 family)